MPRARIEPGILTFEHIATNTQPPCAKSPQQGDLRLSGPPSGQSAGDGGSNPQHRGPCRRPIPLALHAHPDRVISIACSPSDNTGRDSRSPRASWPGQRDPPSLSGSLTRRMVFLY
ncbi:hypothetical protein PoB_000645800 [Plakobranchus ocellatus]|uniref:Uncharacterized protein n=1 Tax=Plakobranchus ocellatus TaxID=259542 RepID=A0AAV3YBT0_9GAST|nr:hypothetical protein PoB_000645800 [Plakobranchus ocellatus]